MSRPIILTEDIKNQIKEEFSESLDKLKMSDGKLNYSKSFNYTNGNVVVWLTPEAYMKTLALVTNFSDEVGWHGTVSRIKENEFIIEDIFVYPQEVTGSTVNTDQEVYSDWLYKLNDEEFSKLRMQGHSHVNMGVSPSGVDSNHRQKILEQLDSDMFYIFMIWNKSLSIHTIVYDMERNVLYEDKDVEVKLLGDETEKFLNDVKEKVQKKSMVKSDGWLSTKKNPKNQEQEKFDPDLDEYGFYPFGQYGLGGSAWNF